MLESVLKVRFFVYKVKCSKASGQETSSEKNEKLMAWVIEG